MNPSSYNTSCDFSGAIPADTIHPCCTQGVFAGNDDGSLAVTLPFPIAFFTAPTTSYYVNNNGNLSPQSFSTFTPFPLIGHGSPVIAPYLADVDTAAAAANNGNVVHYGNTTLYNRSAWCATWVFADFFPSHTTPTRFNSFQVCLIDASTLTGGIGDFDFGASPSDPFARACTLTRHSPLAAQSSTTSVQQTSPPAASPRTPSCPETF